MIWKGVITISRITNDFLNRGSASLYFSCLKKMLPRSKLDKIERMTMLNNSHKKKEGEEEREDNLQA